MDRKPAVDSDVGADAGAVGQRHSEPEEYRRYVENPPGDLVEDEVEDSGKEEIDHGILRAEPPDEDHGG